MQNKYCPDITVIRDIDYLGSDREEKMDAYLPSSKYSGPHPAIVLIHGGGWRLSDKAAEREVRIGNDLASNGYAVFSINYLLNIGEKDADGNLKLSRLAWPQNFYDCKSSVRFLRLNAKDYNLNPDRIAVMGGSAGGHLAMMVGSTIYHSAFNQQGLYTNQSNAVSCILNFYGDFDIRGRRVSPFAGAMGKITANNERDASPVTWIDSNTAPMFITHGTLDKTIPVERSRFLVQHLNQLGLNYTYVEIAKGQHSYDLHPEQMDLEATVLTFLGQYL
ncbi:alpha/beta hydrolase [Cerasicoccus fimbriatus]|uniref:alpha/beta hydrolase n=1 Tax=Cerasicoccus fimbriatus TaxID=3014554 RepID=UPI0022B3F246|nr:alpha/beta hydrolase [Cerasicoccus sp. TK19100]